VIHPLAERIWLLPLSGSAVWVAASHSRIKERFKDGLPKQTPSSSTRSGCRNDKILQVEEHDSVEKKLSDERTRSNNSEKPILRQDHEPPAAIAVEGWRYHHLGIPTTTPRSDEVHVPHLKIHVAGFESSACGIQ
jgi:hypothetical protein